MRAAGRCVKRSSRTAPVRHGVVTSRTPRSGKVDAIGGPSLALGVLTMTRKSGYLAISVVLLGAWVLAGVTSVARQNDVPVVAIQPPATPLPAEADSASVTKFSFIAYGDTRGRRDGSDIQYRALTRRGLDARHDQEARDDRVARQIHPAVGGCRQQRRDRAAVERELLTADQPPDGARGRVLLPGPRQPRRERGGSGDDPGSSGRPS